MRAIYPPVEPGDPDWRDYYGTLNLPNHYHNGGIWPFLGGFYVAALVKMERLCGSGSSLGTAVPSESRWRLQRMAPWQDC